MRAPVYFARAEQVGRPPGASRARYGAATHDHTPSESLRRYLTALFGVNGMGSRRHGLPGYATAIYRAA